MSYYPVFLELKGKTVLVIGGGKIAERKVKALVECDASIRIIAEELTDNIDELVKTGRIQHVDVEFNEEYLDQASLVIVATDKRDLNHIISEKARNKGIFVNSVDQPSDCDFIVPSIVRRGDLLIAISTSGKSPALAKNIRKNLEKQYGEEYESFLKLMGRLREIILSKGVLYKDRNRLFSKLTNSGIQDSIAKKNWKKVSRTLNNIFPDNKVLVQDALKQLIDG